MTVVSCLSDRLAWNIGVTLLAICEARCFRSFSAQSQEWVIKSKCFSLNLLYSPALRNDTSKSILCCASDPRRGSWLVQVEQTLTCHINWRDASDFAKSRSSLYKWIISSYRGHERCCDTECHLVITAKLKQSLEAYRHALNPNPQLALKLILHLESKIRHLSRLRQRYRPPKAAASGRQLSTMVWYSLDCCSPAGQDCWGYLILMSRSLTEGCSLNRAQFKKGPTACKASQNQQVAKVSSLVDPPPDTVSQYMCMQLLAPLERGEGQQNPGPPSVPQAAECPEKTGWLKLNQVLGKQWLKLAPWRSQWPDRSCLRQQQQQPMQSNKQRQHCIASLVSMPATIWWAARRCIQRAGRDARQLKQ